MTIHMDPLFGETSELWELIWVAGSCHPHCPPEGVPHTEGQASSRILTLEHQPSENVFSEIYTYN